MCLIADDTATRDRFDQLKSLGVRLWIDAFGTGNSSLACLLHRPVSGVKIGKAFVWEMGTDPAAATLVTAIIQIGQTLTSVGRSSA